MIIHSISCIDSNNHLSILKNKITKPNIDNVNISKSIYDKGFSNISFGNNIINKYLYEKSLIKHKREIKEINSSEVENYFHILGIPCSIKTANSNADKMIAYGCYNSAEILRQLNYTLPTKIDIEENEPNIIAACYYAPYREKNYPIRTIVFNPLYDWNEHIEKQFDAKQINFATTEHFLHPFIHELGHNVHYDKLYSKFGCMESDQGYYFNPNISNILTALNMKLYDKNGNPVENLYISTTVRDSMKDSSKYGATLLPETFAEEFTKAIINNIDLFSLRLKRNPFPLNTNNKILDQVLYETWEGLIGDGQGLI